MLSDNTLYIPQLSTNYTLRYGTYYHNTANKVYGNAVPISEGDIYLRINDYWHLLEHLRTGDNIGVYMLGNVESNYGALRLLDNTIIYTDKNGAEVPSKLKAEDITSTYLFGTKEDPYNPGKREYYYMEISFKASLLEGLLSHNEWEPQNIPLIREVISYLGIESSYLEILEPQLHFDLNYQYTELEVLRLEYDYIQSEGEEVELLFTYEEVDEAITQSSNNETTSETTTVMWLEDML